MAALGAAGLGVGAEETWAGILTRPRRKGLRRLQTAAAGYVLRPLFKGVVKAGLTVKDMAAGFVEETGEQVSDLVAAAQAGRESPNHLSHFQAALLEPGEGCLINHQKEHCIPRHNPGQLSPA